MTIQSKLPLLLLLLATAFGCAGARAQVAAPPGAPLVPPIQRPIVINFFVGVDTNSVNQLIGLIDNQIRAGSTDFTILISSIGGDPAAAFTAYNYFRGIHAQITTVNMGNVDSAAAILFCAGTKRYALANTRFLLHGVSIPVQGNTLINAEGLENNLALVHNQDQMVVRVLAATTNKKDADLEKVVQGQVILGPEDAKAWGLIQDIRVEFMPPNAQMITLT